MPHPWRTRGVLLRRLERIRGSMFCLFSFPPYCFLHSWLIVSLCVTPGGAAEGERVQPEWDTCTAPICSCWQTAQKLSPLSPLIPLSRGQGVGGVASQRGWQQQQ